MSVRLFHKNARIVLVTRREPDGSRAWWSPHRYPRDWREILQPAVDLLALQAEAGTGSPIRFRLGAIHWTNARYWSTITLRFEAGSARKRDLVARALLKAARYRQLAGGK